MPPVTAAFADRFLTIAIALLIDLLIGDPPNRYHPVAWIGAAIAFIKKRAPALDKPMRRLIYGAALLGFGALGLGLLGWGIEYALDQSHPYLRWLVGGILLKSVFSFRKLLDIARQVGQALRIGDLPEARRLVSWHLVSRDTSQLDEPRIAAAAIESVAENTSDSVIAPLFYYLIFGLSGAFIYRFANTMDAMLGYHDPEHEWLGKAPARVDDLLNLIPARLTALLFILAAMLTRAGGRNALRIWLRDRGETASPNAGHPMSAAAGALGVELEKVGQYRLGSGGRLAEPDDLERMARLALIAVGLGFSMVAFLWVLFTRETLFGLNLLWAHAIPINTNISSHYPVESRHGR